MYICLCKSVTERDIRRGVLRGDIACMESLRECLGASTGCGGCELAARECLEQALEQKRSLAGPRAPAQGTPAEPGLLPDFGDLSPA